MCHSVYNSTPLLESDGCLVIYTGRVFLFFLLDFIEHCGIEENGNFLVLSCMSGLVSDYVNLL